MTVHVLPAPALVVFVKPAGIGGTTLLRALTASGELDSSCIVSADALRLEYHGDEASQARPACIFAELFLRTRRLLAAGSNVWVDITGLDGRSRRTLVEIATAAHVTPVAALRRADFTFDLLRERNRSRARVVPDTEDHPAGNVLARQFDRHRAISPASLEAEGFSVLVWGDGDTFTFSPVTAFALPG